MTGYRHTQPGWVIRWALGLAAIGLVALWAAGTGAEGPASAILGGVLLLVLAALVMFHSLTVTVDQGHLTDHFGPGAIKRTVALEEIGATRAVRNAWFYGWGQRVTLRGPLWRVSGFGAVELELSEGRWLIGTDDVAGLMEALAAETD